VRTSPTPGSAVAWTSTSARALPPPVGTRDLLPPEASARRGLVRRVAEGFELHGYALVTTPPFELAETIERGLGADPRETLRFVDPETGEVSVFRPDLTVQVARLVASGLRERPAPLRLYYEGHVLRARRGRARRQRQVAQIGAECIGIAGAPGDAEIIELASRSLERVGLSHRVEIAAVPMVRALAERLPAERAVRVTEALSRKDARSVERALAGSDVEPALVRTLVELESLMGGVEILARVRTLLEPFVPEHVSAIESLCEALARRGLSSRLRLDLGEVRGLDYYTGPSFALLADGPGEPLGAGGRYDDLLGRFGRPLPASGFAIDLDHLARAIAVQGRSSFEDALRVVLVGTGAEAAADALRTQGVRAAVLDDANVETATAYAESWQLGAAISLSEHGAAIHWVDGRRGRCASTELGAHLLDGHRRASAEDGT
jgi:ATP phosphoribosyltransferase regulatory subunit